MIEQEMVETPVEEKSMEALAEILRERGIRVTEVLENVRNLKVHVVVFEGDDDTAFMAAETALNNGYPLYRLISYRYYYDGRDNALPDRWDMEFFRY